MNQNHQLLIIGGPNAGKTHFVGQLYKRLQTKRSSFRMVTPPTELNVIKEVLDRLSKGLAGQHTDSSFNEEIHFVVANDTGEIGLTFPDYGGEQIKGIVRDRLVSSRWQDLIDQADEWLLFVRPDEIQPLEDITTRTLADIEDLRRRATAAHQAGELTEPSFYVELLQILLHVKGKSVLKSVKLPRLTVALSCWDTLELPKTGIKPAAELYERLPFLANFLEAAWEPENWRVLGLSSLGKTLSGDVPDLDFVDAGPAAAGYVVLPSGEHHRDLTLLITF
jgi:hypothetical protein